MLERTVRTMSAVASPLVVVAADKQDLPEMRQDVILARDSQPQRGPLEGMRSGLRALPENVDAAYITSCDVPFLSTNFVRRMAELLGDADICVPEHDGFQHPLAAVYRPRVLPQIDELLAADRRRPVFLFDRVRTRIVQPEELADIEPEMQSLQNLNHPDDYRRALAKAGFELPGDIRAKLLDDN